jgi:hypothetical protein
LVANFSGAQVIVKESFRSDRRSARHDIAGRRHFAAARRKKHACAKDLEKSAAQFWFALDTRHRAAL